METKNYKSLALGIVALLVAVYAGLRLLSVFGGGDFVDFRAYYDTAQAVLKGNNPFLLSNLHAWEWAEPPICFPGLATLSVPFALFPLDVAKYIFLFLNFLSGLLLFFLVFRKFGITRSSTGAGCFRTDSLVPIICLLAFVASSPFISCLKHGQVVNISSVLILLPIFFVGSTYTSAVSMALSAVTKYSMLTVLGPALFFRGRYFVCIIAFVLFVIIGLFPLFFGCDIFEIYTSYLFEMKRQLSAGYNTYQFSGYNMLHLDLFKFRPIGTILKILVLSGSFFLVFRGRKKKDWTPIELTALSSATMLISYHRLYDLVLPLSFMLVAANRLMRDRDFLKASGIFTFCAILLLPESFIYTVADILGSTLPVGNLVYLSPFRNFKNMLPLYPFLCFSIFAYSLVLSLTAGDGFHETGEDGKRGENITPSLGDKT
jgi:hypothetical protein